MSTVRVTVFAWRKPLILVGAVLAFVGLSTRQHGLDAVALAALLLMAWSAYPVAGTQKGYPSRGALHFIVTVSVLGFVTMGALLVMSP